MKKITVKKLAEQLNKVMSTKNITPKELAKKAKISYSSLMPILNGARECGVSKLVDIANALGCAPDMLLKGSVSKSGKLNAENAYTPPKYLAVFISIVRVTYCMLYESSSNNSLEAVLPFPLRCGDEADFFLENILGALEKFSKDLNTNIHPKEVAVFASAQQYGRKINREKIQNKGGGLFSLFLLEWDAITNHEAFIGKRNGICVTINTGDIITYSADHGKTITPLQGFGFPISDVAGNYWIGCEAIKHAIHVKENREVPSLISDRLLALFNDDIFYLGACTMEDSNTVYSAASNIVKEFVHYQPKANEIIKKSFDLLFSDIKIIDKRVKKKLPIFLSGELAYLYESFFPKERLFPLNKPQSAILLQHGLNKLKVQLSSNSKKAEASYE